MWHILPTLAIKKLLSAAGKIRNIDQSLIEHTKVHAASSYFYFLFFTFFFVRMTDALLLTSIPTWSINSITVFNKNTADF